MSRGDEVQSVRHLVGASPAGSSSAVRSEDDSGLRNEAMIVASGTIGRHDHLTSALKQLSRKRVLTRFASFRSICAMDLSRFYHGSSTSRIPRLRMILNRFCFAHSCLEHSA